MTAKHTQSSITYNSCEKKFEIKGGVGVRECFMPLDHGVVGTRVSLGARKLVDVVNQTAAEDKRNLNETCAQTIFTGLMNSKVDTIDPILELANKERPERE